MDLVALLHLGKKETKRRFPGREAPARARPRPPRNAEPRRRKRVETLRAGVSESGRAH